MTQSKYSPVSGIPESYKNAVKTEKEKFKRELWKVGIYEKTQGGCYKVQIEPIDREKLAVGYAWDANSLEQALCKARLMAAAPDLLEALKNCVYRMECGGYRVDQAKAAINKAEGRA
jgi:hypothetical protein